MKRTLKSTHVALIAFLLICVQESLAARYYPLSPRQCKAAVENIGEVLQSRDSDSLYKGTFVSPSCELRRIQDTAGGLKTAFLLRSIEISKSRRWIGNYYFYSDQDCMQPMYGLNINGKLSFKNNNLTLSINSLSIAVYSSGFDKELVTKYNNSCPEDLSKTESGKYDVYTANKKDILNNECLKALGVGIREFGGGASFETHEPKGGVRSDELLQTDVDLTKNKNVTIYNYQWPLVRHNTRKCLTCTKIGVADLKVPPTLYVRNGTSLNGVWASVRCHKANRGYWTARIDKFNGNKFDLAFYQMEHTRQISPHRCQIPRVELRVVGTLRHIGNSAKVPGGVVYELFHKHAYLTPHNKMFEQIFNAAKKGKCGKKTWEVGKTQDVTEGCSMINYTLPQDGMKILIRTVQDENRKEMYLGYGVDSKTGPLQYQYKTQSCNTYPVEVTTTPGPTDFTTAPTEATTTQEEDIPTEEVVEPKIWIKENVGRRKPTSNAVSLNSVTQTLLLCLLLFWQGIRLA